ncbi:MAG: D-alanine--D-alanine ligase [Flavobacteriales bacterium]
MAPVWLWYAMRAGTLGFFSAANPRIRFGGMGMESKMEIYDLMPDGIKPKTIFANAGIDEDDLKALFRSSQLSFPVIAKPDIGMKALAVEIIENESELLLYSKKLNEDFLIQQFIPFKNEIGIFYCRIPGEPDGMITGMVEKEFLKVKGDGRSTIFHLIRKNPRSALQLAALQTLHGEKLNTILNGKEEFHLVPFGSHTRGARFIDVSNLASAALHNTVNNWCNQVDEFYFGRLDIRYNTMQELSEGKNCCLIEINGAGSEPTHIYDPSHSVFFAWKEIARHWQMLFTISKRNHKRGIPYSSSKESLRMMRNSRNLEQQLKSIT